LGPTDGEVLVCVLGTPGSAMVPESTRRG
jgi:hypothetical protein